MLARPSILVAGATGAVRRKSTYVVLGSDRAVEVLIEERNLLENVAADTGDLAEEEEGEGTGGNTEGASNGSAKCAQRVS